MNPTKLVATYARVSTTNQENEGTIATQLSAVTEFAQKNGYVIVQQYSDEGWSGDSLERPSLDQLRMDAKNKKWDAVLTYDPDRLARRGSWVEIVTEELHQLDIEVLYVTIPPAKNDEESIMLKMRGVFTEYERMKIKERFRLGKVRKIKEGHLLVSEALYGYTYIPKNDRVHGYYEVNPEESRVVQMIFNWVANDCMTLRKVVKKLQELNISPRRSKRNVWNTSTLCHMLKNKGYIGESHWGSTVGVVPMNPLNKEKYRKVKKTSRKQKPKDEWYMVPIPPIIDKDIFDRAKLQLEQNFKLLGNRNKKNQYLLGGLAYCDCGRRRTGEGPQQGKHLYYRCTDRVYCFPLPRNCFEKGINARIADNLVWEQVVGLMTSPELLLSQMERWANNRKTKALSSTLNIPQIEKDIAKLKAEEERYTKAYGAGVFTMDQLTSYTQPVRDKIIALESQIIAAGEQETKVETLGMPDQEEVASFAAKVGDFLKNLSFEAKRDIIINVIDRVVGTPSQLQVYGYIPIANNLYVEYKSSHRYRRTSKRGEVDTI